MSTFIQFVGPLLPILIHYSTTVHANRELHLPHTLFSNRISKLCAAELASTCERFGAAGTINAPVNPLADINSSQKTELARVCRCCRKHERKLLPSNAPATACEQMLTIVFCARPYVRVSVCPRADACVKSRSLSPYTHASKASCHVSLCVVAAQLQCCHISRATPGTNAGLGVRTPLPPLAKPQEPESHCCTQAPPAAGP